MANKKLVDYIREQIKKGFDLQTIRNHLLQYGYSAEDLDEAVKLPPTVSVPEEITAVAEFMSPQFSKISNIPPYVVAVIFAAVAPESNKYRKRSMEIVPLLTIYGCTSLIYLDKPPEPVSVPPLFITRLEVGRL